ncbi:MAG: hypothetical protein RL885_18140 [Planctomycetota bacterium]
MSSLIWRVARLAFSLGLLWTGAAAQTVPWKVDLKVQAFEAADMRGELAQAAVPLPVGLFHGTETLGLFGQDGKPLPVQFDVRTRWSHLDGSIAWLGMEFPLNLDRGTETVLTLRERRSDDFLVEEPKGLRPLVVRERPTGWVIDTGVIEVWLNDGDAAPFSEVRFDADGDGQYREKERIVYSGGRGGATVRDSEGRRYRGGPGLRSIEVEREGPWHVVVRLSGTHVAEEDSGLSELFDYTARLHFERGSPSIGVEWTVRNARSVSPWGPVPFRSYALEIPWVPDVDTVETYFETDDTLAALTRGLTPAASNALVGIQQGPPRPPGVEPGTPAAEDTGYALVKSAGRPIVLHRGDRSTGGTAAVGRQLGMGVRIRDFWQHHPKGLLWNRSGLLTLELWPQKKEASELHTIEDQTQKTHEIWFTFFRREGELGDQLRSVVSRFPALERRAQGRVDVETLVRSGLWSDTGDLAPIPDPARLPVTRYAASLIGGYARTMSLPTATGWQRYGAADPLGRPDRSDLRPRFPLFGPWLQSGASPFLELAALRVRHTRDLRPFHLDGLRAEALSEDEPAVRGGELGERFGRDRLPEALADLQESLPSDQEPYYGNVAYGPDLTEVELLVEHYCLLGSRASLDAAREIGEQLLTWPAVRVSAEQASEPLDSRATGWLMRALGFLYRATADERYRDALRAISKRLRAEQDPELGFFGEVLGAGHLGGLKEPATENWSAAVLARGLILTYRLTGDVEVRDMLEGLVDYWIEVAFSETACQGRGAFRPESLTQAPSPPHYRGLPREEWLLPGLVGAFRFLGYERYRDKMIAVLPRLFNDWNEGGPAILVDWFQGALIERARFEEVRRRPDLTRALAAVRELTVNRTESGLRVELIAPGEPGRTRAVRYQLKLAKHPMKAWLSLEEARSDAEVTAFWSVPNRFELPEPKDPGEHERFELPVDLEPGLYFVAVRWEDQRGRHSPISESVRLEVVR